MKFIQKVKEFYTRTPPWLKNKYAATLLIFLMWWLIFDSNDLLYQIRLNRQIRALENKKEYYQKSIEKVKREYQSLFTDTDNIEAFAREVYWMKKDNEDLYVIIREDD